MAKNKTFYIFFITILLVNIAGVFNKIFVADSALYAAISKNMLLTNNWLELFVNGKDWLDKPHFQFWLCALSMKIFGVSDFAYKLPSFLSFLLSLVYIYRFSVKVYSKEVGLVALLVFSSALHIIVSNNDVRAEAIMLPLIIAGTYHFYFLSYTNKLRDLILGALFTAAAIMTKGVFILIPIAGGVIADIVLKKRWNILFRLRWLWSFLLIFIFIIPELWAVYYQFDLHPETVVFGRTNVSGVKFFSGIVNLGVFSIQAPLKGREIFHSFCTPCFGHLVHGHC